MYAHIKMALASVIQKVVDTKYVNPKAHSETIAVKYERVVEEIKREFQTLTDGI